MKDIIGYENLYAVTEDGRVWSYRSQKFLKLTLNKDGYLYVSLSKNGMKTARRVHRLVAEAFIPNPEGKPEVNHKNEDKTKNCVDNLEWVTRKENCNYGTRNARSAKKRSKSIYCVELDRTFDGIRAAARELNLSQSHITECCKGTRKTCGGYHFTYSE